MMPLVLGIMAGTCFYAAIHHFQNALHLRRLPHLLLAMGGVAFGLLCLFSVFSYMHESVALGEVERKLRIALGLGGALAMYWFVGLRTGVSRKILWWMSALFGLAIVMDLMMRAGLNLTDLRGFEEVRMPWGDVYQRPIAQRTTLGSWVLRFAVFLPVPFLVYAIRLLWRRGDRWEAGVLMILLVTPLAPAFVDIVLVTPGWIAFPYLEIGLAVSMLLLSMLTSHDVAQAAALRSDLAQSEEAFRRLVETAPEAIGVYDAAHRRFLDVNRRAEEVLGRPAAEIRSADLSHLFRQISREPETSVAAARQLLARALRGEDVVERDWQVIRPDGTPVACELRLSAMGSEGESLVRVSLLDVSEQRAAEAERRELEGRLQRAERLENLGTLAGGIAHDLNNMLTPVVGFGEFAQQELEDHPARLYVAEMQTSAERAAQLTEHILTFSRQSEGRHETVEMQPAVEQALRFLCATLPARIELDVMLAAPEALVEGDATQVHQVIMSLGTNAAQAMDDEGRLRVALWCDDDTVILEVADTGPGMDETVLSRMFDPFFTTKTPGQASGLGLSVVHGIVASLGGTIDVESTPGKGSLFRIRLPRVIAGAAP